MVSPPVDDAGRPLPPLWDGRPVKWRGWSDSVRLHCIPDHLSACETCGAIDDTRSNTGIAEDLGRITAYRCRHCGQDSVYVWETGEEWILDADDYGPAGSSPPGMLF